MSKDKIKKLSAVLNTVCNESDKRLYGKYWNLEYDDVMDYIQDKSEDAPYYVTTYYKTEDYSDKDVFKSTFDDYVVFDNIFIDFDNNDKPEDAINQGIRVAKHLKHDLGLDVLVNYSGSKGCHIHLLFNPIELEHPAEVLELFTKQIESNYNVTADPQVYKSLKRLKRIPCSKHDKTGNYAHFIDFEDKTAINTTLNNAEYSPFTIIDNNAKYYIPTVPDKTKNTKIIEPILKRLDKLADSSKANANDTTEYDLHIDLDTDNEFINKFKKLYYKGNRWNIGHAVIYMFKRSGWNDAEILNFFDAITPSNR